jgi:hypothetical protein
VEAAAGIAVSGQVRFQRLPLSEPATALQGARRIRRPDPASRSGGSDSALLRSFARPGWHWHCPGSLPRPAPHLPAGRTAPFGNRRRVRSLEDSRIGIQSFILKVGHHGSRTSTRPEFLSAVNPAWAVISCGRRNRFGHPREEVLAELQSAHARTFRTDIEGGTCFLLDGKSVSADPMCSRSY